MNDHADRQFNRVSLVSRTGKVGEQYHLTLLQIEESCQERSFPNGNGEREWTVSNSSQTVLNDCNQVRKLYVIDWGVGDNEVNSSRNKPFNKETSFAGLKRHLQPILVAQKTVSPDYSVMAASKH